ncbi:MAG: helix-turn-helix transcriptional regulator [Solirubrobacterales bacterium]
MSPQTVAERRRLYLLARLVVKRHYAKRLTLAVVAKALATSPRQLQRAYAQFGDDTFRDDLTARRLTAAAELLSQSSIPVRQLAGRVGYRQPSHFARAFRRRYGVSPALFRAERRRAAREHNAGRSGAVPEHAGQTQAATP